MLMDLRIGKTAHLKAGMKEYDSYLIRFFCLYQGRQFLSEPIQSNHFFTPTIIFSKRAGAVPCPTCIDCAGSPFPQVGIPQIYQESLLATPLQLFQKYGVVE